MGGEVYAMAQMRRAIVSTSIRACNPSALGRIAALLADDVTSPPHTPIEFEMKHLHDALLDGSDWRRPNKPTTRETAILFYGYDSSQY